MMSPQISSAMTGTAIPGSASCVLTINGGSSSLKFALFGPGLRLLSGTVERLGLGDAFLRARGADGSEERRPVASDMGRAAEDIIEWLDTRGDLGRVAAVGHRIVHGGPDNFEARLVTPDLVATFGRISPLDPSHLPGEIALIEAFDRRLAGVPQVACFDTGFHRDLPTPARVLPIPRRYQAEGVRRYGFHGLSYTYLLGELGRVAGDVAARGKVILAHLGSGASMAAVHDGRCLDTTMGLTPAGGLVMGTRAGDLDPGVLIYLLRTERLTVDGLDDLVNRRSGLLGVSETSPDMRDLLSRRAADARAAEAIELYCYQARKWVGALAAALGGLDTLVFSGGVGENAPEVRAGICDGLGFLGIRLDPASNGANADVVSSPDGACAVRVIKTDEELMIARTVVRLLGLHLDLAPKESADA